MPLPSPCRASKPGSPVLSASSPLRPQPRALRLATLLILGTLLWGFAWTAVALADERRVALVLGNGAYTGVAPLTNPGNDASDVAVALEGLGFEVMLGLDSSRARMAELIERFKTEARSADVTLFFYAGHAFQVESSNHLIPVDFTYEQGDDITQSTIDLGDLMLALETISIEREAVQPGSSGIHVVFLDACRDNPFQLGSGEVRSGLASVAQAAGFLFEFATAPDQVALDGPEGGRNSPFTQALLNHINTPGQDIAAVMSAVRRDVRNATGGDQVPWGHSSLGPFALAPVPVAPSSRETSLWQLASNALDENLLDPARSLMLHYLSFYPEGPHVPDVQASLAEIETAALGGGETVMRTLHPSSDAADFEERLWGLARWMRQRPLVETYLEGYPDGRFADAARDLLQALPSAADIAASPELLCERLATHPHDATANTAGVPRDELRGHAEVAINACTQAAALRPELPHYTALLARATYEAGDHAKAIQLYRDAAARGDLRALVSLGLITETGGGVPRDMAAAVEFYERAAAGGSPDGANNLALLLLEGTAVAPDFDRALELLSVASEAGSATATVNLGVLAQDGRAGTPEEAIDYFLEAAGLGEPLGFLYAAILLDEGRGIPRDPDRAAEMLLRGTASDYGATMNELTNRSDNWSPDTIRAVETRLREAGLYHGDFRAALEQWRRRGV